VAVDEFLTSGAGAGIVVPARALDLGAVAEVDPKNWTRE
jgi:hypothetical protein